LPRPHQSYAVFDVLQFDMRPIYRKTLQAKLLHKRCFEVFSVLRKIIDVRDHSMAQGMVKGVFLGVLSVFEVYLGRYS
jgi:hypothetical protein